MQWKSCKYGYLKLGLAGYHGRDDHSVIFNPLFTGIVPVQVWSHHRVMEEHWHYDGSNGDNTPHIDNMSYVTAAFKGLTSNATCTFAIFTLSHIVGNLCHLRDAEFLKQG